MAAGVWFRCHGCGATVDAAQALPFRCPKAGTRGDDTDHVLEPEEGDGEFADENEDNPFLRYRTLLSPYRLARAALLPESAWFDIVGRLDEAISAVDGRGFKVTPFLANPELARAAGLEGEVWLKDETGNVSGSHKARHLMAVMLYLRVVETARLAPGEGIRRRRLAIASCGNAALAAAVVARAADWPLEVYIPTATSAGVVSQLKSLGALVTVCQRRKGESGDPSYRRFEESVGRGALPFGVQGNANGLAVEGCRTLAFEMAESLRKAAVAPRNLFVQVGGGALASALSQGFAIAAARGILPFTPRLFAVQTLACAPLERAWRLAGDFSTAEAARARSRFMWPWEQVPASLAEGILDDETYDWWSILDGMRRTGGRPITVGEDLLARAQKLVRAHAGLSASATGTAGLAGALAMDELTGGSAVIVSGIER